MNITSLTVIIHWLSGSLAYITLGFVLFGVWRGTQRQAGRVTGKMGRLLRSPWFYLITSALFFSISYLGWIPLPLTISPQINIWMLIIGSIFHFPGMGLVLWGRLALGKNYFVSTGLGAQLFANHQLITSGPYAIMRHPMYMGLMLSALGSLLIYTTWTTLCFTCFAPFIIFRARREETILAVEFKEQWLEYCQYIPAFLPRIRKERN